MKSLEMKHMATDNRTAKSKEKVYAPILRKIRFWRDYTGTGDLYRMEHDQDCVLTWGSLSADTIFSLWLPLRYTLNYYGCDLWENWKAFEVEKLKPQRLGLKDWPDFLNVLLDNIDVFLPQMELTALLSELFLLGQQRCNVVILPYRSWNRRRGCSPYWDYLPHFLHDILDTDSPLFLHALHTWINGEHLDMFFNNGKVGKDNLKDLAGTGAAWRHSPKEINLKQLLLNYIEILTERKLIMEEVRQ